jgi:hypothetical protein
MKVLKRRFLGALARGPPPERLGLADFRSLVAELGIYMWLYTVLAVGR